MSIKLNFFAFFWQFVHYFLISNSLILHLAKWHHFSQENLNFVWWYVQKRKALKKTLKYALHILLFGEFEFCIVSNLAFYPFI